MQTLIDIGSMKGEEIAWGIEHGCEVHAFEPNIHMKEYLKQYEDKAVINYAAAWNKDGEATLFSMRNPEPGEDGVSLMSEKTNVGETGAVVPTINIGRYLKELDKDIDILKINAEGAEYIILESILSQFDPGRIKNWCVEDHSQYIYNWYDHRKKILEKLSNLGITVKNWKQGNLKKYEQKLLG